LNFDTKPRYRRGITRTERRDPINISNRNATMNADNPNANLSDSVWAKMGRAQDYNPILKYPSVTQTRTLCYRKIIQAENPNSATSLNMLNFKSILVGRGCHTSSKMLDWLVGSQAGWLAGLLLSGIECLKQCICKSCRFCTSGRNLVLKVIQG
jgi:hypothetical protein